MGFRGNREGVRVGRDRNQLVKPRKGIFIRTHLLKNVRGYVGQWDSGVVVSDV
jgi:hypothetical protein